MKRVRVDAWFGLRAVAFSLILAYSASNPVCAVSVSGPIADTMPSQGSNGSSSLCAREVRLPDPQWLAMPTGCLSDWATTADFSSDAMKKQTAGWTVLELKVSQIGEPLSCKIAFAGPNAALDERTCTLVMQRAHFKPATDYAGKSIVGRFVVGVVWQPSGMTIGLPPPSWYVYRSRATPYNPQGLIDANDLHAIEATNQHAGTVAFDVTVSAEGRPAACSIVRSSQDVWLDQTTCELVMSHLHGFRPAIDEIGSPVIDHFSGTIRWQVPRG